MKQFIKIRQGIFETNSSSSHSFSMGPERRFGAKLVMDENGAINVSGDSWYNLVEEKSNDPEVKLSYLLSFELHKNRAIRFLVPLFHFFFDNILWRERNLGKIKKFYLPSDYGFYWSNNNKFYSARRN